MERRIAIIIAATLPFANSQRSQPQFTIKAEIGKAFEESCLIGNFTIANGNIADCLKHCLENCSCQSFQICQNTQCQLCSRNKEDNSSLLHEKNDCVYAMYEMRHLTETFQKMKDQCSGMSCLLKYNCCQQLGVCPKNKICKPAYNITQSWKRFLCECPDGYHGDKCDQPISSCRGYSSDSRKFRVYKVLDSEKSMYEVYCHFDSDGRGAWTLVQSYSYAKFKSDIKFKKFALSRDWPVNENVPNWTGYRLSKERMKSIQNDSQFRARFTCDYEKVQDIKNTDYVEISLRHYSGREEKIIDVWRKRKLFQYAAGHGRIREITLDGCKILLQQNNNKTALHISIKNDSNAECNFELQTNPCPWKKFNYFGKYRSDCFDKEHRCVNNDNSTTQIWFGN